MRNIHKSCKSIWKIQLDHLIKYIFNPFNTNVLGYQHIENIAKKRLNKRGVLVFFLNLKDNCYEFCRVPTIVVTDCKCLYIQFRHHGAVLCSGHPQSSGCRAVDQIYVTPFPPVPISAWFPYAVQRRNAADAMGHPPHPPHVRWRCFPGRFYLAIKPFCT